MKPELEEKLFKEFPKLYLGRSSPISLNLISKGFECGDGWFNLIYDLSKKIENKNDNIDDPNDYFVAMQVKEKFGELCIYLNTFDKDVDKWIGEAEIESENTCENCGAKTDLVDTSGLVKTLCAECSLKYKKEEY